MKNIKKLMASAVIGAFVVAASGCSMIAKTPEGIQKSVVAKVNNKKITRSELDARMIGVINQLKAQYGDNYMSNDQAKEALKQQKDQTLDNMITEKILLAKAKEKKLVPSDSELKKELDAKYSQIKSTYKNDSDWKKALEGAGFTDASLKDSIKNQIIIEKVIDNLVKDTKITDKQIQDYYNANQLQFTEQPNKIHLAHILVKTEDEAKKVKDRLNNGEAFDKVAKEVSTDTGSKDNGGDLGDVEEANSGFDATFIKAGLALKDGEVSAPVQTQFGWHIIKCIKKTEYPVKKIDDVKSQIKDTLLSQAKQTAYTKAIDQWKKESKIKKYEENVM